MSPEILSCKQVEEILSEARPLDPGESEMIARHEESCTQCREGRAIVELLDFERHGAPGRIQDDVTRRRLLTEIIEAARGRQSDSGARPQARTRYKLVAAALAAGLMALGAALLLLGAFSSGDRQVSGAAWSPDATRPKANILLSSGLVLADGHEPVLERDFRLESTLETHLGTAALRLSESVVCLLGEGSRIELPDGDEDQVQIRLRSGTIYVSVNPRISRRPKVTVLTPHGRVEVVGTVFEVQAVEKQTVISVARGMVKAVGESGDRNVRRGESYVLGSRSVFRSTGEALARLASRHGQLRLLQRSGDAILQVDSEPGGAEIFLDGVALGATPLQARIPAEDATLRIAAPGHVAVTELLHVRPGQLVRRDYDLARSIMPDPASMDRGGDAASGQRPPGDAVDVAAPTRPASPGARKAPGPPAAQTPSKAETAAARALSLMQEARHKRLERDFQGALRAYQEVIRRHPEQPVAAVARVSIATLQLDHLSRPAEALRGFDGYLSIRPTGAVAEEAAHGRIRALRALGRTCEELRAAKDFVRQYQGALHRAQVQARVRALEAWAPEQCPRP